ncbi:MAG: hypothetical protein R3E10_09985 [Gemmatimonadota bacterium]
MKVLKALLLVELLLAAFWVFPVLFGPSPGQFLLQVVLFTAPFHLACMGVGAWWFFRRPATRRWAALVVTAPPLLLIVPNAVRNAQGGPLPSETPPERMIALALATPLLACVFVPRWAARMLPAGLFRSRLLHFGLAVFSALAVAGFGAIAWMMSGDASPTALPLQRALFAAGLGAPLLAVPAGVFAWMGLFQPVARELRPVRVIQLLLAAALLAGTVAQFLLFAINPG